MSSHDDISMKPSVRRHEVGLLFVQDGEGQLGGRMKYPSRAFSSPTTRSWASRGSLLLFEPAGAIEGLTDWLRRAMPLIRRRAIDSLRINWTHSSGGSGDVDRR